MWPAYGHEAHQATGPFTPILGPLSLSPGPPLAPTSDSSTGILQGQMKCLFFEEIFWVPHPDGHHPLSLPRPPSSLWFSCGLPLSQFLCLCSPSLVPSPPGSLSLHPPLRHLPVHQFSLQPPAWPALSGCQCWPQIMGGSSSSNTLSSYWTLGPAPLQHPAPSIIPSNPTLGLRKGTQHAQRPPA